MENFTELAKQIIGRILYITIATVNEQGEPWNSPVYSAFDDDYNFYWVSALESEHSKNILRTGKSFLVIYDSTATEGQGRGVYIQAQASMIETEEEINHATNYLYSRKNKMAHPAKHFMNESPRRVWCATPLKVWVNTDDKLNGFHVDRRMEVRLK